MRYIALFVRLFFVGAVSFSFIGNECSTDEKTLNSIVDSWHQAASNANFDDYFGSMSSQFVFLGTAPNERWTKAEFHSFCQPYFEKGKAWDFKPKERNWIFSKKGNVAWFDENLDTWMEECRGSGVMVCENGVWKIAYYNLTVLIENEKIQEFIDLRKK